MTPSGDTISSRSGKFLRHVWFHPAKTAEPHRLCLFLDAEHYLRDMQSLPALSGLQESGALPPMSMLFVSHVNSRSRHLDYVCNEGYAEFLARDVVGWARARCELQIAHHMICGLSLSGLQAAFTACRYAEVFSHALCQSGSFWWLAENEMPWPPTTAKFWLSVGDKETATNVSHPPTGLFQKISQIAGVEAAVGQLTAAGGTVKYNLYSGGHAAAPWKDELEPALQWLLSESAAASVALPKPC
jgi:enterochelin esterase family protein